ncbi:sigma-70 family RNA polymerase sigma factor [Demequina sp. NBRC 110051]|uniref:sigma-70 family RNA polymerase sigma factor n=1 Tax=Demequina sp. NBRC 110051 TaxID=1570340 RepID=UPI000A018DFB|nr:sigma-70 family RNA polymerase sigma factor [Demequina sp. NBRC 110051]
MRRWGPQLEELMTRRYGSLVAFARMATGDPANAEDLVQDALVETFSRRRSFADAGAAEAYTRRVIASRAIDRGRRRLTERKALRRIGVAEDDTGAGPAVLVEHRTDVARALAALTPRERVCVVLRYLEHLSVEETADAVGLATGSVKRYVHDGLAKLAVALGEPPHEGGPVPPRESAWVVRREA